MGHAHLVVNQSAERIQKLNEIGAALSSEKNLTHLKELILMSAKELTKADGGTLYSVGEDKRIRFEIVRTSSLGLSFGGSSGKPISFPEIPLHDAEGHPNEKMVVAYCVLHDRTVNLPDAYSPGNFDLSGTYKFDEKTGYHSQSFLTVPMKNHEGEIIGVLQLINAIDPNSGKVIAFSKEDQELVESLASQAAVAMTSNQLIFDLKELFEAFIKVLADAIDEKSPYTAGHCHRVPIIADMLARAVNRCKSGPLAGRIFSGEELYELNVAALLHDCGKVVTPVHVVDKGTKLEAITDRIQLVDIRFEVLKRDAEIRALREKLDLLEPRVPRDKALQEAWQRCDRELASQKEILEQDRDFLHSCNLGSEFMSQENQDRVKEIGQGSWVGVSGKKEPILTEDEVKNLCIAKGTLSDDDRKIINHHVEVTIKMLQAIHYPKHLRRVPEIAGAHHERMDGKGYPRGLKGNQMSLQARILAIADVFEALTAPDRPYKKGMPVSMALTILEKMKNEGHVDPDLYEVFMQEKVYLEYASQYLKPEQVDLEDLR